MTQRPSKNSLPILKPFSNSWRWWVVGVLAAPTDLPPNHLHNPRHMA